MPAGQVRHRRDPWVMAAVAKDSATAESWQRLLDEAGIEAQVRTDDAAIAGMPSRSVWGSGYLEPGLSMYSYPLYVLRRDRAAARRIIGEQGGLGGMKIDRGAFLGALAIVGVTMLGVIVLVLRG